MTQSSSDLIAELRLLRADERRLRATLVDDLRRFQKKDGDRTFFTLPSSDRKGISVATTCTALMALIDSDKLDELFPSKPEVEKAATGSPSELTSRDSALTPNQPNQTQRSPRDVFSDVVRETWASSGLDDLNAFTTCMVIRAAGFLVSAKKLTSDEAKNLKHICPTDSNRHDPPGEVRTALGKSKQPTLSEIIAAVAEKAEKSFSLPGYPPKTAMAYWFVDGITKAEIEIGPGDWLGVAKWAGSEFERQLSYVVSGNDPLMDPASLAMAACLVSRIRKISAEKSELSDISRELPSRVELVFAVRRVFDKQTESGIWPKSFPLFHFPGSGAADYCFSFEFLEAVLIEFSEFDILDNPEVLVGVKSAVRWCESNRFAYSQGGELYCGWNAGGEITNLASGVPEGWATASVHMFLAELELTIARSLQKLILTRFKVNPAGTAPSEKRWNDLIDVELQLQGKPDTLKKVVEDDLIKSTLGAAKMLRDQRLSGRRSALLFGPPGTSKTSLAEVIAERLGWPLLVITPSDFLSKGLEQIYVRANEIFEDLMDLSGTVVLFDEMDALVQTRENPRGKLEGAATGPRGKSEGAATGLDVTRQLLTTSMLPKLADLHKRARVIFLMATNHRQQLDPAITRPGRFDLLLCVGPPSWDRKVEGLSKVSSDLPMTDIRSAATKLRELADSSDTTKRLDGFTVADLKGFLQYLRGTDDLRSALEKLPKATFESLVKEWAETYIVMNEKSGPLEEYQHDLKASRRQ
jgi:hypothetical protein